MGIHMIRIAIFLTYLLSASVTAQGFKCEDIKEKKVRTACIAERNKTATPVKLADKEESPLEVFVREAKKQVIETLKDPTSPIFSQLEYVENQQAGTKALCGKINAKNSYGGYTGATSFVAAQVPEVPGEYSIWKTGIRTDSNSRDIEDIKERIEVMSLQRLACWGEGTKKTMLTNSQ